eukprot:1008343-Rhodomonas_salina.1
MNTVGAPEGEEEPRVGSGHPAVQDAAAWHGALRNVGEVEPRAGLDVVGVERVGACHTTLRRMHAAQQARPRPRPVQGKLLASLGRGGNGDARLPPKK